MKRITIVGAGSTGHALAAILSINGHEVYLTDTSAYNRCLGKERALWYNQNQRHCNGRGNA